jgi:hypothetical protein
LVILRVDSAPSFGEVGTLQILGFLESVWIGVEPIFFEIRVVVVVSVPILGEAVVLSSFWVVALVVVLRSYRPFWRLVARVVVVVTSLGLFLGVLGRIVALIITVLGVLGCRRLALFGGLLALLPPLVVLVLLVAVRRVLVLSILSLCAWVLCLHKSF